MNPANSDSFPVSRSDLWLYCFATALSVGAVVYHQSMIYVIARDLGLESSSLWLLSTATQFGYGLGLLLGLPLADVIAPRRLIPATVAFLGTAEIGLAAASDLSTIAPLCFVAGLLSVGGQMLIAHCAKVFPPATRESALGALFSSLFTGLLLARLLSGLSAEQIGWRGFYVVVGAATLIVGYTLKWRIHYTSEDRGIEYGRLLRSQTLLWRSAPELRRVALVAACFFAALSGLWANLASLVHEMLRWTPAQTSLLSFTALAGLFAPNLARRLQRELSWTQVVTLFGLAIVASATASLFVGHAALAVVVFLTTVDLCARSVQVVCQGQALALDPSISARINSLFMTVFFLGSALGSWLGGVAIERYGWVGMTLFPATCVSFGILQMAWRRPAGAVRPPAPRSLGPS
jgi:predicted MFS family arabinose efflux permease